MSETINHITQIKVNDTDYELYSKYDDVGGEIKTKYLPRAGGAVTGPIVFSGGDGATSGKISLPNKDGGGQITDDSTATLFGVVKKDELTVGHGSYALKLRGKTGDSIYPTFNGTKIIINSDLAGDSQGLVKTGGNVTIASGIITVDDNGHNHVISNITDWGETRDGIVSELEGKISTAISNLVGEAPDLLRTLENLAAALGNDENYAATVTTELAKKLNLSGGTMTGNLTIKKSNPYFCLQESDADIPWYVQISSGSLFLGGSISDGRKPVAISSTGDLTVSSEFTVLNRIRTGSNLLGTNDNNDTATVKISTGSGGAIYFGKEGLNSGTMLRFDQVDGTARLRFRASNTAGAMVWEQPEQGAQLHIDLGKENVDKGRITFASLGESIGGVSKKANINITGNATTASFPQGFSGNGSGGWGTLTTDNGYEIITGWQHNGTTSGNTGADIIFASKGGQISAQVDGSFYQNEGNNLVVDVANSAQGASNIIPKFATGNTLAKSNLSDDGSTITLGSKVVVKGTGDSYNECIRILPASNKWSNIYFSGNLETSGTTTNTNEYGWLIGRRGTTLGDKTNGVDGDFTIECNSSDGRGLTIKQNGDIYSYGNNLTIGGTKATIQYNTSDKCIDIIFN